LEIAGMFDDPFADFECQVQARKASVALLERLDDAQRMQIVIETVAEAPHLEIELFLAGVRERRMADIMRQSERFGQVLIETENRSHCAGDLRHLDRMGQPRAKVVGETGGKDLRLGFETAEGAGMHDPVAVTLERIAIRVIGLGVSAPPALAYGK